jgi:riboflavin biosynthesis pyrimidine reductase
VTSRFAEYCRGKERAALAAQLFPYKTVESAEQFGIEKIGNVWTRRLFDGDFFRSARACESDLPITNLVFVESQEGNTVADDPSTLGGGDTDKHLIYEGLSRIDADAVLAGASTARNNELVFSVWHPELVALRLRRGRARHPAQVVVCSKSALPIETALMFQEPSLPVYLITTSDAAASLRLQVLTHPWVHVIDGGCPLSMRTALRKLKTHAINTVSAVGGRTTARTLLSQRVVQDLYLTTSAESAGAPNTPLVDGALSAKRVVIKEGTGPETGVRFVHYLCR